MLPYHRIVERETISWFPNASPNPRACRLFIWDTQQKHSIRRLVFSFRDV